MVAHIRSTDEAQLVAEMAALGTFERMRRFVADGDRGDPPAFVGRTEEIGKINCALETIAKGGNKKGQTHVLHGDPGTGKTATLAEIARRNNGKTIGESTIWCAEIRPANLSSHPQALCAAIRESIVEMAAKKGLTGKLEKAMDGIVKAANKKIMAGESTYETHDSMAGLGETAAPGDCFNAYARNGMWPQDAVIVLLLDETQNLGKNDWDAESRRVVKTLDALHAGVGAARIMLVCAGLRNTVDVLADFGLSRNKIGGVMDLGLLEEGEGREALEGSMEYLGLVWGNPEWRAHLKAGGFDKKTWASFRAQLIESLEAECSNFPQHLNAAVSSVCETLIERRGVCKPDQIPSIAQDVHAKLQKHKDAFYDARFDDDLENHRAALAAIATAANGTAGKSVKRGDALETLKSAANVQVKDNMDTQAANEALDLATRRSILRKGRGGAVLPPAIPSMVSSLSSQLNSMLAEQDPAAQAAAKSLGINAAPGSVIPPRNWRKVFSDAVKAGNSSRASNRSPTEP